MKQESENQRETTEQANQALAGLKVIELGSFISAAYCTKLMADLGAEVIKVEEPKVGDEARYYGPFPEDHPDKEKSGLFLYLNANKLGITLNVKTATGRKILGDLIKVADVLVENNPPKLMDELSLNYATLKEVNPNLVMTSITPFGQTGPYRDYKAYAINCVAAGGFCLNMGQPKRTPLAPPFSLGHYESGTLAAGVTIGALIARPALGRGQHVDVSEMEAWGCLHTGGMMNSYIRRNFKRMRLGHRMPALFPNGIMRCKGGHVGIIANTGRQWKNLLETVGGGTIPEWYASNPNYHTGTFLRDIASKYADEIETALSPWLMSYTKEEIFDMCRQRDVPCCPINTMADVANSPHLAARGYFITIDHPQAGKFDYPGAPYRLSETPWRITRHAPLLGEHNREIYHDRLGYSDEEIVGLERGGII